MPNDAAPSTEALALLRALIAFDTVSRNSNLGLIEWTRDYLRRLGVGARLSYDASGAKANLFATLGEPRPGGIALCGHSDVVPVDGQPWDSDPFCATERDGRLYGRGACDMKGFIACALAAVPQFLAAPLKRPLHLALTYDEEVGCLGAPVLLRDLQAAGVTLEGCIVGEPTGMQVMTAHKGRRVYRCMVRGLEAHSSLAPQGVNAIEYAALLIAKLRELAREIARSGPRDESFAVPFPTLSAGMIRGGTATNIVARECEFFFDVRPLPGSAPETLIEPLRRYAEETLLPEMRRLAPDAEIRIEVSEDAPALATANDDPLAELSARLVGNPRRGRAPFCTDGGHFHRAGIPTVVLGPGSVEQAHKPNEFIALAQLAHCERFLYELQEAMCR